ncbi:mitogen-activated protein kinase-binding protein 1 [Genypterus blacodes]|uniref:mitogen-activated protein kinase-binding protein 1 n=1 Tax=Genypterus blacodes TaxID=154954 RepID=UPI003F75CECF
MMAAEGSGTIRSRIKNLLRSPSIKLRRRSATARQKHKLSEKVTLEKVLGITVPGNRALACQPRTGLLAYPAGCVVILLNPLRHKQLHIFNSTRKAITTLAFSPDGKYVVTGESGHMPAVRLWEVSERQQVAELQQHKFGVACVAFSPNGKYIISVGYQHDMMVNVWNWKKNVVVAANKVSSKVTAVSFSDDSSYFVTAGNRHVKFWYLDHSKTSKVNATVPLLGRSALLGELRNNFFSDVACGRGRQASSTFCITSSGLLCEFNDRRLLDKWVELRVSQATCLSVTDELIFCGCSGGTVRAFSPVNLHFLFTLPRPHCLGADIASIVDTSQLFSCNSEARYPDTVAVTYDPTNRWLSCVYNDHSVYVWDIRDLHDLHDPCDLRRAGKLYSALYHSSCVWSLEVYPNGGEKKGGGAVVHVPPGSFLSCSSDNTIRLWNIEGHNSSSRNILSHDLQKVIYVDNNVVSLLDTESVAASNTEKAASTGSDGQADQSRSGIRTLRVSPDGQHLASGDRMGVLRIHNLHSMEEILNVQAHDSEILCLEFTKPDTGMKLLATASRDRLIHVLDGGREYSLLQTLDEHSSSITAVRFAVNEGKVRMISCGADKSVYFRTAQQTNEGLEFTRTHHVVRKTTLYDMDVDPTRKYAAVGCQDRSIRIFNISNGKQKKLYKGSQGEDGTLIKVQIDPSGLFIATSCSDKNISIFDFYTGECVATMYGHSEIVTGMKFSSDCKHLITASGDSCIFVWRLSPDLTIRMRQRLSDLRTPNSTQKSQNSPQDTVSLSNGREVPGSPVVVTMSSDSDKEEEKLVCPCIVPTAGGAGSSGDTETPDEKLNSLNSMIRRKENSSGPTPRKRWSRRMGSTDGALMVKSMLDLRLLDSYCPSKQEDQEEEREQPQVVDHPSIQKRVSPGGGIGLCRTNQDLGSTISLQVEHSGSRTSQRPDFILLSSQGPDREGPVLYPDQWEDRVSLAGSEFLVMEVHPNATRQQQEKPSPDSGCSLGFSSSLSSPDRPTGDDSGPTEQLSIDGNSELEEEEEEVQRGGMAGEEGLESLKEVPQTPDQDAFLKQHFETLADLSESPSRASHSSSESLSISSRFLSQNSSGRTMLPLPSRTTDGGGEVKVRPLISEVRPLMEQNHNDAQGRKASLNQDQTPNQTSLQEQMSSFQDNAFSLWDQSEPMDNKDKQRWTHDPTQICQDQNQHQQGPDLDQYQTSKVKEVPPENISFALQADCFSPGKKKFQVSVASKSNLGPLAHAATSDLNSSSGLRKAQSVHSLLTDTESSLSQLTSCTSKEVAPQVLFPPQRPTTLPSSPRRPPAGATATHPQRPSPTSSRSPQQEPVDSSTSTVVIPRKLPSSSTPWAPRSYMSPTASSMAKMSRSVSMSDGLNCTEPAEDPGPKPSVAAETTSSSADTCASSSSHVKESSGLPVAPVPSNGANAMPPHAAVIPVVVGSNSSSSTVVNHGNQTGTLPRGLQARLPGNNRPLPDKPSLACFSPSTKTVPSCTFSSSPSYQPLPITVFPLTQPKKEKQDQSSLNSSNSATDQGEEADEPNNTEACKALVNELQSHFKKATHLYRVVSSTPAADSSPDQLEMASILSAAFQAMRTELNSLPLKPPSMLGEERGLGGVDEEKTMALLEEYSLMLLQAVHRRISTAHT